MFKKVLTITFQFVSAGTCMLRLCKHCETEKPHEDFVKNAGCKFGITHKCKACFNAENRATYPQKRDKILATQKRSVEKRRAEGKDVNKPSREYNKRNPEYKRFYASQRKTHVRQATPSWLTSEQKAHIKRTYRLAQIMKDETGIDYHVDHIIPLRGENICGLHVPQNLQVLKADLNLKKSNIYS